MKAEVTQLLFAMYVSYFYVCTCDGTGCPVTTAHCATEDVSSSPTRGKGEIGEDRALLLGRGGGGEERTYPRQREESTQRVLKGLLRGKEEK